MGKLIPFCTRESGEAALPSRVTNHASEPPDPTQSVPGTQHISMLARLLELVPQLDEMAGRIDTLNKLVPALSLGPHFDRLRLEILSEIDLAKSQAIHFVMSALAKHDHTKGEKSDEH